MADEAERRGWPTLREASDHLVAALGCSAGLTRRGLIWLTTIGSAEQRGAATGRHPSSLFDQGDRFGIGAPLRVRSGGDGEEHESERRRLHLSLVGGAVVGGSVNVIDVSVENLR